jgi:sulfane dehydrogenase subunit SoxC
MNSEQNDRRRFLKDSAALAALAVGGIRSASGQTPGYGTPEVSPRDTRAYGERSRFEKSTRKLGSDPLTREEDPFGLGIIARSPLQDQTGIITPAPLHYVVSRYWGSARAAPDIDPRQHRLLIHGMVDRPLIFTLEELKRLPRVSRIHFVECASNSGSHASIELSGLHGKTVQETHGWTSCSEWSGVPLSRLLLEAGVQKGAGWLIAEGADPRHHYRSIPMEKAMDDCLVCYGQNGEAVRPDQGYPLRLLVPGFEGVTNVKWLRRIKVVDQPYMPRLEATGYTSLKPDGIGRWFQFEMPPISVITLPSGGQRLPSRGFYEISGLAWSGSGAIRRVEVSTDGGRNWKDAQLQEPVHRKAHTLFHVPWNWDGEEAVLQSRCTDELDAVQPTLAELSKFWGVSLDYWQKTNNYISHFNPIWSWKVTRDGGVHNATFS